jgi:SAM-dependent methyltransferase
MEDQGRQDKSSQIAEQLLAEVNFTGGPTAQFEAVGRETLVALLECGILPHHNLLDFGCGALRLGWWLIRFMDEGRYFGIEPNTKWLDAGKQITVGEELLNRKKPRFNNNAEHRLDVFDVKFDAAVARSVLTHLNPGAMRILFQQFAQNCSPNGFFLVSYWEHGTHKGKNTLVGESLANDKPHQGGMDTTFKFKTIQQIAAEAGLEATLLDREPLNIQPWVVLKKKGAAVPQDAGQTKNSGILERIRKHTWGKG